MVILATSRHSVLHTTKIVHDYCESYAMVVNGNKTKFLVTKMVMTQISSI